MNKLMDMVRSTRVRQILLGVVVLAGIVTLGSYLWRARLPYDVHSTDGSWLPATEQPTSTRGVLDHPNDDEYGTDPLFENPPRKILLVTIDTLRADHLSGYGYPKETSPFLDTLAEEGLKFTNAFAPMSTTLPSHASIMTGLYPMELNVRDNHHKVRDRFVTLAEHLREKGYTTAGFVSTNRHFASGNLDQGFETFDEPSSDEQAFRSPGGDTVYNLSYRPASRTLEKALSWVESRSSGERQFLWVHLFDPHFPYAFRPDYHEPLRYEDRDRRMEWMDFVKNNHHFNLKSKSDNSPENNPYLSTYRLYDGEIRYVDSQLRSFYRSLGRNWTTEPFTIITSDHGEGMGSHDWWGHSKYVYNEQIRVPLILHHPALEWDGTIEVVVELNDLFSTLTREARVSFSKFKSDTPVPRSFPLQTLTNESNSPGFGYAFAMRKRFADEMNGYWGWARWRWRELTRPEGSNPLDPDERWSKITWPGQQYTLLDDSYSYVYNTALRDEFFDQKTDFYQTEDLIGESRGNWRSYAGVLHSILNRLKRRSLPRPVSVDPETRRELKGLGYVN